jgi:hypothetical protein
MSMRPLNEATYNEVQRLDRENAELRKQLAEKAQKNLDQYIRIAQLEKVVEAAKVMNRECYAVDSESDLRVPWVCNNNLSIALAALKGDS